MKKQLRLSSLLVLTILLVLGSFVYASIGVVKTIEEQDIYYSYVEGQRILQGENPYERILSGDMRINDKYATYFPLFYEFSYLVQALGREGFSGWLEVWRFVFVLCCLGTGVLLFLPFWQIGSEWIGIFASAFWLFNRWTLTVISIVHLDFLAVVFLVGSLLALPRYRRLSLLLYSVSLAFKHISIFLLPLYLIWIWISLDRDRWKETLKSLLLIGSVPLLSALPFLIWNAKGFLLSISFSLTRFAFSSFSAPSLDDFMDWNGILGRVPMLILLVFVYWFVGSRQIALYTGAFLIMSIFIGFNSVLFVQYMVWLVPLSLLLILDLKEKSFILQ
jgi:hypothetical protein